MSATDFQNGRSPLNTTEISFYNGSGSDIVVGSLVKVDTAHGMSGTQPLPGVAATSAVTDYGIAVAIETVKNGQAGRFQSVDGTTVWGIALGAISLGAVVGGSATAGQVTTYTATDPSFGIALSVAVSAADPILLLISKSQNK